MITLPGYLAIRTINGRNGEFNVGRLATSIGEFVIKDALLDQYLEGKYRGDFVVTEIRPSYYTNGGSLSLRSAPGWTACRWRTLPTSAPMKLRGCQTMKLTL
ncbi:hypothetical protein PSA5_31475 [Pseudomonas syringae pv. actinidiae]|nr:hypothetical protein PSA5_31475 [Pseudomonas syringae pv. actinidiae]